MLILKSKFRLLFFAIVAVLALRVGAIAQVASAAARDPEGARHARRLTEAFVAAKGNAEDPGFLKLFDENPNLTRRSFLPLLEVWETETDPKRAELAADLYSEVAGLALERFTDYVPNLIIDTINEENPDTEALCERYTAFLIEEARSGLKLSRSELVGYGPYSNTYTAIDLTSDYTPEALVSGKLFHAKGLRFKTAFQLENFPQVSKEQETYKLVLEQLKGRTDDLAGSFVRMLESEQGLDAILYYYNLCNDLESGLLDRSVASLNLSADDPKLFNWRNATLYLAAARVAYEQARLPVLKRMLGLAREEMSQDKKMSRFHCVLDYVIRTDEYRLRRLEGFDPSDEEIIAEFGKAWSALDLYGPMTQPDVDATWLEGRHATRFWLDELARAGGGQEASLTRIAKDWQRWWDQTLEKQRTAQSRDDLFAKWAYVDALYVLGPNYFDQVTYRWAKFTRWQVEPAELEWIETAIEALPQTINWVVEEQRGAAFPPYDLSSAGLLPEMMARCKLQEARTPGMAIEERIPLLEESVLLSRKSTYPLSKADHLIAVGREFLKCESSRRAVECWEEALKLTEEIPLAKQSFVALFLLAQDYYDHGDFEEAAHFADLATKKLEVVSPLIGTRSSEARGWSRDLTAVTSLAAQSYIAGKSPEKALAAITFGGQLQAAALQVEGNPQAKQEADELRQQQQEVSSVTEQVAKLESQPASSLRDNLLSETRQLLADSKAQYLVKSRELRQKYDALYSQALKFDPLDLPSLQSQLPTDVAVLQFFPTEDTLYTFLVSKESFRLRSVAVSRKELDKQIVTFLRGLRRNVPGDAQVAAQSRQLYDALIAPSLEDLQGKSSVVLIPTGRLHGLPFACLTDPQGEPLVAKWRLLELAKSTDLQRLAKEADSPIESMVAFANATGDLPAAQSEGEKVVSIFPKSKLFDTKDATKSNFFSYGGGAQVLHIATHGEWNLDDSLQNYLSMAGSEKIAQEEIFQLSLDDTSLVILSACNTAMGEGSEGGYVASLAEAFWLAGSHSVVASLWAVDDSSTAMLMETFYQRLKAGDDKAEALRAAQLKVRSEKGFEHPYYWAGFVLFGERR